jgi:hypothetical protein
MNFPLFIMEVSMAKLNGRPLKMFNVNTDQFGRLVVAQLVENDEDMVRVGFDFIESHKLFIGYGLMVSSTLAKAIITAFSLRGRQFSLLAERSATWRNGVFEWKVPDK